MTRASEFVEKAAAGEAIQKKGKVCQRSDIE